MSGILIGHQETLDTLNSLLKSDRIPHGLLLVGPEGIGKSKVAYRLQHALLEGEQAISSHALEHNTPTGQLLRSGAHPDALWMTRKTNEKTGKLSQGISVEEARKVTAFFQRKPALSKRRVVVVDAVDDLNTNGANALLKVLEEPPVGATLILIAHRMSKVLPTLRSRSQMISLRALSSEELKSFVKSEFGTLSPDESDALVALSAGSPGCAKMLYDQGGLEVFDQFLTIVKALNTPDFSAVLNDFVAQMTVRPKKGQENQKTPFQILRFIMEVWLARAIKFMSLGDEATALSQEAEALKALKALGPVSLWSEAWAQLAPTFDEASVFALEPSSVLFDLFARWKGTIPLVRAV